MASIPAGSNAVILEVLDRTNYKHWRARLETYLMVEDLWEVVEASVEPSKLEDDQDKYKAWTKKNVKALYAIQNACGRKLFSFISDIKTAKGAWDALEQECNRSTQTVDIANTASNLLVCSNALILEVLNRDNYENWRPRVKTYLVSKDLWEVVESNTRPIKLDDGDEQYKAWRRKNSEALYTIQNSCGPEMFPSIREIETAKKAWEALEQELKVLQVYDENNADHVNLLESFIGYVLKGDWDEAKKCGGEVDVCSFLVRPMDEFDGGTALHIAAQAGHVHFVKELLPLMTPEDFKTKNLNGHTALHLAAAYADVGTVKALPVFLLGEVKDNDGDTALHIAVQEGKVEVVKELVLLMREEDLKIKNDAGYTALHLAVNKGNMLMVKALLRNEQGEINHIGEEDFDRYISFITHVSKGDWDKAKECLTELDDPCNAIVARYPEDDWKGATAIHIEAAAAAAGHVGHIKELVLFLKRREEEELKLKTSEDFVAFGSGLDFNDGDVMKRVKFMVEQYEKTLAGVLEIQNADGETAFYMAIDRDREDIGRELAPLMTQQGLELKDNNGCSPLHLAVSLGHMHLVRELVSLMRPEALEEKYKVCTALDLAISVRKDKEVVKIANWMAEKNNKVVSTVGHKDLLPVSVAVAHQKWVSARFLYSVTPRECLNGSAGTAFLVKCLDSSKGLDMVRDLLQQNPILALTEYEDGLTKVCPLLKLAALKDAFLSGKQLSCWQRWIYNGIHIGEIAHANVPSISVSVVQPEDDHENTGDFISSDISLFRRFLKGLYKLCGIHCLYEMKLIRKRIFDILRIVGEVTKNVTLTPDQSGMITKSIFLATKLGHFEFVTHLFEANPRILDDLMDSSEKGLFPLAIENRQKEIYTLIYAVRSEYRSIVAYTSVNGEKTLVHYAANLYSLPESVHIEDASLQMQRELQWFKEVESFVTAEGYESLGFSNNYMTARELFTMNHGELRKDAEISIKGTATSCTVAGALIVTMMFAAAITFPGGNNGNTGLPLFLKDMVFKVFLVSDTVSLASSTSSVITFLGILTSRYAENDFLESLPRKIMIGLITLFISIVSMMIVFSCALILILDGDAWIVVPSILLTSIPVILFVWLLFPFLIKTFISTYGPGIVDKKLKMVQSKS